MEASDPSEPVGADRTVDAREIDGEPFSAIAAALEDLDEDGTLLLVNDFEPVPLYDVLEQRGFTYDAERESESEWQIRIEHA